MKSVFDATYPPEQLTAAFWEEVIMLAQAEALLRRMDEGKDPPPQWGD